MLHPRPLLSLLPPNIPSTLSFVHISVSLSSILRISCLSASISLFFSPSPLSPSPSLSSYRIAMLGSCFVGPHTTRPPQGKIWSHFMMSYRVSVFGFWCPLAEVCFIFFYGLLSVKKCVLFSFWAICLNAVFEFEFVV